MWVKIETSMNRLATFHKVGPGRGEHDGEKSFRIGSLICRAVRARSYAKMGVSSIHMSALYEEFGKSGNNWEKLGIYLLNRI